MTHRRYFHVIFHVLAAYTRRRYNNRAWNSQNKLHGSYKNVLLLKMVIILMIIQYKSRRSK